MNVRVEISSGDRAHVVLPLAPRRELAQASIVPIADRVAGIMFDDPAGALGAAGARRLTALVDGEPAGRPAISTSLALRSGGRRHLQLVGRAAASLAGRAVTMALGGELAAEIDPEWLQPPIADGAQLIDGLSEDGQRRLLKLFLTTGASLFGFGGAAEFGLAARRLLDLLGVRPIRPASWCPIGSAGGILSFEMPGHVDTARVSDLVSLTAGRITRLSGCRPAVERNGAQVLLHVDVARALPQASSLIGLGEVPVHLLAPDAGATAQPLLSWTKQRDVATRRWAERLVDKTAETDPVAAALMREMCHDAGNPAMLEVRHLSATPTGVLYAFELSDPHDLVRAVRLEREDAVLDLELAAEGRGALAAHELAGYAGLARQSRVAEACRLRLVYRSGRVRTVHEGLLDPYRGELPRGFAASRGPATALAQARLDLERPARACFVEDFGAPSTLPKLSVIAGVSENLDVIRARAAMVFAEPRRRHVEMVYHIADGAVAKAARRAIGDAAAVFGIPHRLVVLGRDADMADRLLAALGHARGGALLAMGADVLPAGSGWLTPWLRRLGPARPILGGTLIDHSGAVIHAGARLDKAPNAPGPRYRGLPTADLPRAATAPTELVSAECVGLTRAAAEALRATRPYPDPGIMLAEAAHRLRLEGNTVSTLLCCRFVRFAETREQPLEDAAGVEALRLALNGSFGPSEENDLA